MIESRLDPLTDDTGGGHGRYPGLSVAQIAERYRFLVEEGQGRSATAILRIAREQTLARGTTDSHRWVIAFFTIAAATLLAARSFVEPSMRLSLAIGAVACVAITFLFAIGTATIHRSASRGEVQVREIRRLTLVALDELTAKKGFVPKPLEREHITALHELRKVDPKAWKRVSDLLPKA